MKIRERAARYGWDAILVALGIEGVALDGKHHPCPGCGGRDRFRYIRDDHGGFFCSDLRGDGINLVEHMFEEDFKAACRRIESIIGTDPGWKSTCPRDPTYAEILSRTAVKSAQSAYLASRGLEIPPGLQWHQAVTYWDDGKSTGTYAAMLAPVTRGVDWLTYHVTYLQHGKKAPVCAPRKFLPTSGCRLDGASVALYEPTELMGVAEGIENAIAAKMLSGIPVWAALSTALMKSWQPPSIAKRIVIFGDNDPHFAGHAAAYALANRLSTKWDVEIRLPPEPGTDWNDVLLKQKAVA